MGQTSELPAENSGFALWVWLVETAGSEIRLSNYWRLLRVIILLLEADRTSKSRWCCERRTGNGDLVPKPNSQPSRTII